MCFPGPGPGWCYRPSHDEVADWTPRCFYKHVPAAVPGIIFLSGGQSDEHATANLNVINSQGAAPRGRLICCGRALRAHALKAWNGKPENGGAAQRAYYHRARTLPRSGIYTPEMERETLAA